LDRNFLYFFVLMHLPGQNVFLLSQGNAVGLAAMPDVEHVPQPDTGSVPGSGQTLSPSMLLLNRQPA